MFTAMVKGIVAIGAMSIAYSVQASTAVSCLLAVQVLEKFEQPIGQVMVKAKVLQVKANVNDRNDLNCKGLFQSRIVSFNVPSNSQRDNLSVVKLGQKMWISYAYRDDRGGAWSNYSVITKKQFLEKKHGI
jgi:hypothetical protein